MCPTTRDTIETLTDAVAADERECGAGDEPEGMDEGLHLGRAWHRYRYCYRPAGPIRVLDVGCGTGRSSAWAARLNPGASVLGIDASPEAVAVARERAAGLDAAVAAALDFRVHDPSEPMPDAWGRFDFVVCRGLLARADDPHRLLADLARVLDPGGLLLVSSPSQSGRQAAGAFRRAVETLLPPGAGDDERAEVGLELFQGLRPDHPIRAHAARTGHPGADPDDARLVVADFFAERYDWSLDEAAAMLARAGLDFLYAATPWRWRPDRAFAPDALTDRLGRLDPGRLSRLVDALDPTFLDESYQLYACPSGRVPPVPDWPVTRLDDPRMFDGLVPRLTGLVDPSRFLPSGAQGRVSYRSVSGNPGELDRWSRLLIDAVDGTRSCGEIEKTLAPRTRASDDPRSRQDRWIDLADQGIILLDPDAAR